MTIPTKFGSNWPSAYKEEDSKQKTPFWHHQASFFSCTSDQQKNMNFLYNHPMNIPNKQLIFWHYWASCTYE